MLVSEKKIVPSHLAEIHKKKRRRVRFCSRFVALLCLILLAPLLICIALLVRLESQGACLYSQRRVGLRGKSFTLYKFRSMHDRSSHTCDACTCVCSAHSRKNCCPIPPANTDVTRIGRHLRRWHVDELPQLWNIARGDMCFVGPRPERVELVAHFQKNISHYNIRHVVRPGLTGLAQISYHRGISEEDARNKLFFDVYYIQHMSWKMDMEILLRTVPRILFDTLHTSKR